jgi:hypothetical protein
VHIENTAGMCDLAVQRPQCDHGAAARHRVAVNVGLMLVKAAAEQAIP